MSKILDPDLNDYTIPAQNDELDEVMLGFLEIRQRHSNINVDPQIVLQHLELIYELYEQFEQGTADADDLLTITDIEALFKSYQNRISEKDFLNFHKMMENLKAEASLIKKKRRIPQERSQTKEVPPL
jgi:hypothetical protein